MSPRSLTARQWLNLLMGACILPTVLIAAFLLYSAYEKERSLSIRRTLELARALVQTVDRELASARETLKVLASSQALESGDLAAFYERAKLVQQTSRPANNFVLSDAGGQQIFNTLRPFGAPMPRHGNPAQHRRVFATALPVISDLYLGGVSRRPVISIDMPVMKDGKVIYDLSMGFFPEQLGEILKLQRLPPDWVAVILDSKGVIVARTWDNDRYVGSSAVPALVQRIKEVREGTVEVVTLEGVAVVTSFSRSGISDWSVAIGIPRASLLNGLRETAARLLAGTLLSIVIGLLLAKAIADRIVDSIHAMVAPAIDLGYGKTIAIPGQPLREANAVAQALGKASALLRERTVERDVALRAEQEVRRMQGALEHSEAFLRGIFEEAPNAVFVVNRAGGIVRANEEAKRLFGYPGDRLLALNIDELVPSESRQRHAALRANYFSHPERRSIGGDAVLKARRSDGAEFPVDLRLSPLRQAGEDVVIAIVQDISERVRNEERIGAALREKETLLKEVYHRVKNNLQIITSLFNLQERSMPDAAARTALREAAERVHTMALVHEKLYQSRDLSSIMLDGYVADLCRQLEQAYSAAARGISLSVAAAPLCVSLDIAIPIGLLLNELVSNCMKHAFPEGQGGHITVRLERIGDREARLIVADDGVGLPAELRPPYGSSLGLKLVDALATRLDGRLSLHSGGGQSGGGESGTGVVATIRFPVPQDVQAAPP